MVIQALKCKSKQIFFSGIRNSMTFPWFFPGNGIPWFFHIREIFFTFSMTSLISPWWWAPCPIHFVKFKFAIIPPCFEYQQYLWNIALQPAVGCYNLCVDLRCLGCSPLGEKSLWNRTIDPWSNLILINMILFDKNNTGHLVTTGCIHSITIMNAKLGSNFEPPPHLILTESWVLIQYKDVILPVQDIPLWR